MSKEILYIIIFILLFISLVPYIYCLIKRKKLKEELITQAKKRSATYLKEINEKQAEIEQKLLNETQELTASYEKIKQNKLKEVSQIEKEINEKKNFNSSLLKIREEELNRLIAEKKTRALSNLECEINDWARSAQEAAQFQRDQILKNYQQEIDETCIELQDLHHEIDEYRSKRDVMNQEILRARAVEEQQDFYRVQIPDSYKHDLALLNEIRHDFSKIDILDKLIYDNYIKKPVDEMIQRVLEGQSPSGIYKITRLKTGEIYIGKSTDIKARWQQHCKSCYHCGTISHSKLHTIMENDKIWNFTFELLEKVPKEQLTEREKYWINFYDSKTYGLNQREG